MFVDKIKCFKNPLLKKKIATALFGQNSIYTKDIVGGHPKYVSQLNCWLYEQHKEHPPKGKINQFLTPCNKLW